MRDTFKYYRWVKYSVGVAKAITHGVNMTSRVAWEDVVEGAKNGTPRALMIDLAGVRQTANLRKMLASGLRPEISTGSWYRKPASLRNALNDGTAAQRADVVYIIAPDQRSIRQDASESERRDVDARNRKDRKRLDLTISQIRDADPSARI